MRVPYLLLAPGAIQPRYASGFNANGRSQNALPFHTAKKMPHVTATVTKIALCRRSNASDSLMLLFTQFQTALLTAISSRCLAALLAKMSSTVTCGITLATAT